MTEEEKRAIEILEDFKKYGYYKIQIKNDDNRARTTHLIENSLDIILNLISNLQKENEELKQDNSHQWEERCKLTFEIERLQKELEYKDNIIHGLGTEVLPISIEGFEVLLNKTKEENDKLQKELDKKDKVIDELIMLLLEFDIDEIYCSKIKDCFEVTDGKCFDCIKQYFYEQVKKVGGEDE